MEQCQGDPPTPEVRERAVKMFVEHRHEYPSEWAAMTLGGQARHDGRDAAVLGPPGAGRRRRAPGLTTDERQRMKELEREVKELRRANEILKAASVFFATELDGQPKR